MILTGLARLDDALGGLLQGRIHLLTGGPGSGKTAVSLRFLWTGLERGETGLLVTLGNSRDLKSLAKHLGMARRAQGFLRVVNIVPGPIGVFRRDVLLSVGGYDDDTFAEDADLTLTLLTGGWHVVYEERAIAYTEAPETLLELVKQRYRWTRGILQALRKRASWVIAPKHGIAIWFSFLMMLFEAILWPALNVLGNVLFATAALSAGAASGVLYWWVLLTMRSETTLSSILETLKAMKEGRLTSYGEAVQIPKQ